MIKIVSAKVNGGTSKGMQDFAEKKLEFLEEFNCSSVKLTVEPIDNQVKTTVAFVDDYNHHYRIGAEGDTFYAAVDLLKDKCKRAIRKFHEKVRKNPSNDAMTVEPIEDIEISREKLLFLEDQTFDQALNDMMKLGHDWYIFRDADTKEISVIYERVDQTLGVMRVR